MTLDGIPCGYQVFPGNVWEDRTLIDATAALRARHPAARFTVVADAGLLNSETCKARSDSGIAYILGARLKSTNAATKAKNLAPDGFEFWTAATETPPDDTEPASKFKELRSGEDRLIVTWSAKRAKRDAERRKKALDRLLKRIKKNREPATVSQTGRARFLTFPRAGSRSIPTRLRPRPDGTASAELSPAASTMPRPAT